MNPIETINQVILQGFLGRDADFRTFDSGCVLNFSIATKKLIKKKSGDSVEYTEWHNITAWGRLADEWRQHALKGVCLRVEGELKTESWNDKKHGDKRYKTVITANSIERVDYRNGSSEDRQPQHEQTAPPAADDDSLPF